MGNPNNIDVAAPRADRRNLKVHQAIIGATIQLLETVRYTNLTIESVAATAGVGKATVYRWWPSKGALVAEAISTMLCVEDAQQTDDVRADLVGAAEISIANYAQRPGGALLMALAADLADDSTLLDSFLEGFVLPRRRSVTKLIERAIAEGDIMPNLDPDLLMDMWAGAVMYRKLIDSPIDGDLAPRLVDAVLAEPCSPSTPR